MQHIEKKVPRWTYIPQTNNANAVLVRDDGTAIIRENTLITKDYIIRDGKVIAKKIQS